MKVKLNLRRMREALNLTQEELAERLDIPTNTLARWERGELYIRHATILHLALREIKREIQNESKSNST